MGALKRHMTPPTVIATLALAVAVGGSGAIALPGRGDVDASDLGRNVVASKNIKPKAVQPGDIDRAKAFIAVEVGGDGEVTQSTVPGVSAGGYSGDAVRVTFPRDITDCSPVATAWFGGEVTGFQAGTAPENRDDVLINHTGVDKSFNLILIC